MAVNENFRTAVAEGRVLAAVRRTGARGDTLTGSVKAEQIMRDGQEAIMVSRTEAWVLTREQWQGIVDGLHLNANPVKEGGV